jgi:hypothetical protein
MSTEKPVLVLQESEITKRTQFSIARMTFGRAAIRPNQTKSNQIRHEAVCGGPEDAAEDRGC